MMEKVRLNENDGMGVRMGYLGTVTTVLYRKLRMAEGRGSSRAGGSDGGTARDAGL